MSDAVSQPAMDEILASIRKIIAEEPPVARPAGASEPAPGPEDDVLELGPQPSPVPMPSFAAASPPAPTPAATDPDGLLSARAETVSRSALAALAEIQIDPKAADNTLDGLVRELLRPMLADWLDRNLPEIVERMVAREIARLGGR